MVTEKAREKTYEFAAWVLKLKASFLSVMSQVLARLEDGPDVVSQNKMSPESLREIQEIIFKLYKQAIERLEFYLDSDYVKDIYHLTDKDEDICRFIIKRLKEDKRYFEIIIKKIWEKEDIDYDELASVLDMFNYLYYWYAELFNLSIQDGNIMSALSQLHQLDIQHQDLGSPFSLFERL